MACVAQLVEHGINMAGVRGSGPAWGAGRAGEEIPWIKMSAVTTRKEFLGSPLPIYGL